MDAISRVRTADHDQVDARIGSPSNRRGPQCGPYRAWPLVFILGILTCSLFGQEAAKSETGGGGKPQLQRYKSVTAEFTWDTEVVFPDMASLVSEIAGPTVAGAAAKEKLAISPEEAQKGTKVDIGPVTGTGIERGRMAIILSASDELKKAESPAKVDEYLSAVAGRLQGLLVARIDQSVNEKIRSLEQIADQTRAQAHEQTQLVTKLRSAVRDISNRADASPQGIRSGLASLDLEQQKLSIELVGQQARQKMLQITIKQLSAELENKIVGDPVMAELDKVVRGREQEIARVREMVKVATASKAEAIEAETRLAEARIKLLERRETAGKSAGGDLLAEMNKELLLLSINTAETQARRDYINQMLDRLRKAEPMLDELEAAVAKSNQAAQDAKATERSVMQRLEHLRAVRRPYVVIGHLDR